MRKLLRRIGILLLVVVSVWLGGVLADRQRLREDILRLHVVGASDSAEDQDIKLQLKDAVVDSLKEDLQKLQNAEEAMNYLQENLPKIEAFANRFLRQSGCADTATGILGTEEFSTRVYETFSLPSGV